MTLCSPARRRSSRLFRLPPNLSRRAKQHSLTNFRSAGDAHRCKLKTLAAAGTDCSLSVLSLLTPPLPRLRFLLLLLLPRRRHCCCCRCRRNKGYLKMFLIPPGARHVTIQEHEASPQLLGKSDLRMQRKRRKIKTHTRTHAHNGERKQRVPETRPFPPKGLM